MENAGTISGYTLIMSLRCDDLPMDASWKVTGNGSTPMTRLTHRIMADPFHQWPTTHRPTARYGWDRYETDRQRTRCNAVSKTRGLRNDQLTTLEAGYNKSISPWRLIDDSVFVLTRCVRGRQLRYFFKAVRRSCGNTPRVWRESGDCTIDDNHAWSRLVKTAG